MTTVEFYGTLLEAANITPDEVKVELAIRLFEQKRISIHQAHLLVESQREEQVICLELPVKQSTVRNLPYG